MEVNLKGEFLPSTSGECGSWGVIVWSGWYGYYFDYEWHWSSWTNDTCDGYAPLVHANDPDHSFWVSEELYNTNVTIAYGAADAGSYWTDVGQELGYTTLNTSSGGDSGVYPDPFPEIGVPAVWDPGTNNIYLNTEHYVGYSQANWTWITAHELGHGIGFDHSTSIDYSKTIMMANPQSPDQWLHPRKLEKCAAIKAFPVNIKQ